MSGWIRVTEMAPPFMQTVILCVVGKVMIGWNEAMEGEDPSYCSYEEWPKEAVSGEQVTHWMLLPNPPDETQEPCVHEWREESMRAFPYSKFFCVKCNLEKRFL